MPLVIPERDDFAESFAQQPVLGTWQYGRKRLVEPTEAGLGLEGRRRHSDEYDLDPEDVPRLPETYRWDGLCEFFPQPWADRARTLVTSFRRVQVICFSCNPSAQYGISDDPERALAWASDHDTATCDHEIVIVDPRNGMVVARNDYSPLDGTQGQGARHREILAQRKRELYRWQRTIR